MDFLAHKRQYQHAVKYRCVARWTIFPNNAKELVRRRYFDSVGISNAVFEKYWKSRRKIEREVEDAKSSITRNFEFLFKEMIPPYRPGRFNRESYAALYTSRDVETAKEERFHHVPRETTRFEYIVYSLSVSGEVADLRPLHDSGAFVVGPDHAECQEVADQIRMHVGGVAWYSVRKVGGACCAFFSCDGVIARRLEAQDDIDWLESFHG